MSERSSGRIDDEIAFFTTFALITVPIQIIDMDNCPDVKALLCTFSTTVATLILEFYCPRYLTLSLSRNTKHEYGKREAIQRSESGVRSFCLDAEKQRGRDCSA